ncbi:MAG: alanine racemase [Candidatus Coproplasma sp.]
MQKTLSVINLTAIRNNAGFIRSALGKRKFYAVVKADAYGHGAIEVAREIEDIVDGFCVAICDEGAELRISGIQKPILVLAPVLDTDDAERCRLYDLTVTVCNQESAHLSQGLDCHIKINTGMNRYGCDAEGLKKVLSLVDKSRVKGVYSHLFAPENDAECEKQYALFLRAAGAVKSYAPQAFAHLSATAGILKGGKYLLDGARCGIALYGYAPNGFSNRGLVPALRVYARRAQTTSPVGDGVGYNLADREYKSLSTYRLGYADGFFRTVPLGEKTLCMDAFISQSDQNLLCVFDNADEYAQKNNTISYEVLCSVTRRSERIYERRASL